VENISYNVNLFQLKPKDTEMLVF